MQSCGGDAPQVCAHTMSLGDLMTLQVWKRALPCTCGTHATPCWQRCTRHMCRQRRSPKGLGRACWPRVGSSAFAARVASAGRQRGFAPYGRACWPRVGSAALAERVANAGCQRDMPLAMLLAVRVTIQSPKEIVNRLSILAQHRNGILLAPCPSVAVAITSLGLPRSPILTRGPCRLDPHPN